VKKRKIARRKGKIHIQHSKTGKTQEEVAATAFVGGHVKKAFPRGGGPDGRGRGGQPRLQHRKKKWRSDSDE